MNIKNIAVKKTDEIDEAALRFNTYFNLTKSELNVTAGGVLRIIGRLSEVGMEQILRKSCNLKGEKKY